MTYDSLVKGISTHLRDALKEGAFIAIVTTLSHNIVIIYTIVVLILLKRVTIEWLSEVCSVWYEVKRYNSKFVTKINKFLGEI